MNTDKTPILNHQQIEQKINRISYQIYETFYNEKVIIIVGIEDRGYRLAQKIYDSLSSIAGFKIKLIRLKLDKEKPNNMESIKLSVNINELIDQSVILVDDVLNTGKTLMYSINYLLQSPIKNLKTVVLIDRSHKNFPVKTNFIGISLSTTLQDHISVDFSNKKNVVYLE